jgi:hypothetical protein
MEEVDVVSLVQKSQLALPVVNRGCERDGPGWYVRVLWQYGQEQHVSGFASADEAQNWVHKKSEGWLRNRTAAFRGV